MRLFCGRCGWAWRRSVAGISLTRCVPGRLRLVIWEAQAESARSALVDAQAAEREQPARSARARHVFEDSRAREAQALDEGADPGALVAAAVLARAAAEIAERQEHALMDAQQAREVAVRAVAKAARRIRKAWRKLAAAERGVSAPGLEAGLLALLPGSVGGGASC